jgi:hypothetical protein
MFKAIAIGVAVVGLGLTSAQAQTASPSAASSERLSSADLSAILDARVAATKFALQLTPEQLKLWPPVEEAIRSRAAVRHMRIARLQSGQWEEAGVVELMRQRADNLMQRGASLKKLADAWQPLAATLTEEQKHRLAALALFVLREARELLPRNRSSDSWEDDGEE